MNTLLRYLPAAVLAVSSVAMAAEPAAPAPTMVAKAALAPQEMSDAQMDQVAAGIANFGNLVAVDVSNVLNNNDVQVAVPVNAAVAVGAVGILSRQTGVLTDATSPGRLNQNP